MNFGSNAYLQKVIFEHRYPWVANQTNLKLKSLIMAQIERWRQA
ncbi:hypothetical protein yruck0001_34750 [Yersinia ruckeri ATCC 29473]|nr:hypothetical protein yruck0001_34750 [Yersinia ruckeri ATCC 29473]